MSTLREILKEQAAYVKNSGFVVDVDFGLSTVTIANNEDEIYLDGVDGAEYIEQATQIWEEAGDIGMNVALYSLAKQFVDSL